MRGIALAPVQGLGLDMEVTATGAPIRVPVGDEVRGRMLDVFGLPMHGKEPLTTAKRASIHVPPPPITEREIHAEVLQTGIKALDLLLPIKRGGKTGLFWWGCCSAR